MIHEKSIFASTTFWGALLMLWLSASPTVKEMTVTGFKKTKALDLIDSLATTIIVIIGRYNAKEDLFTPKYLPGRDKQ